MEFDMMLAKYRPSCNSITSRGGQPEGRRTTEAETEVEHLSCQSDISRAIGAANPRAQMARAGPALRFLEGRRSLALPSSGGNLVSQ